MDVKGRKNNDGTVGGMVDRTWCECPLLVSRESTLNPCKSHTSVSGGGCGVGLGPST